MRNKQHNKETKMKTQEQLRQEGLRAARNMVRKFKARVATRKVDEANYKARVAKRKADAPSGVKTDKPKPTGDGPSGFDYWHDTHRHC